MNWVDLIIKLVPIIIELVNPRLRPIADDVAHAINSSEQTRDLSSQEKLNHAVNLVMDKRDLTPTEVSQVQEVINKTVEASNVLTT